MASIVMVDHAVHVISNEAFVWRSSISSFSTNLSGFSSEEPTICRHGKLHRLAAVRESRILKQNRDKPQQQSGSIAQEELARRDIPVVVRGLVKARGRGSWILLPS
jgi:hypothetical protein